MAEYTITVSGPTTLEVEYEQGFAVEPFESTGELSATINQGVSAGSFESTGELFGAFSRSVSAGSFESTGSISGTGTLINVDSAIVLFKFVLTGANDSLEDIEISISSFQMRQYNSGYSYLNVVIPNLDNADDIDNRSNGTLELYMVYAEPADLSEIARIRIVETAFEYISIADGPENQSITLSGNETTAMQNARQANVKTLTLSDAYINYSQTTNGSIRIRLSKYLPIYAGDTVVCSAGTFEIDQISWTESVGFRTIELAEAA